MQEKKKPKMPAMEITKDPDLFSLAWRWLRGDLIIAYKNLHRQKNHMFQKHKETDQSTKSGKFLDAKFMQLQNGNKVTVVSKVRLLFIGIKHQKRKGFCDSLCITFSSIPQQIKGQCRGKWMTSTACSNLEIDFKCCDGLWASNMTYIHITLPRAVGTE